MDSADGPDIGVRTALMRRVLLFVLMLYWIAIFTGTHLPDLPSLGDREVDKVAHFLGYGGLAFLLSGWLYARGWLLTRTAIVVLAGLLAYAAIDELLQLLVGRDAEILDVVADILGATLGLGLATACRALLRS